MRAATVALLLVGCTGGDASGDVAALESRLDGLESDLAAATDRIEALETDLAASDARVAVLEDDRDDLEADLEAVTLRVTNVETDLGTLDAIESDVAALETTVGGLGSDVGALESDVSGLETDVGTLETDVGTLETDVGTLETDVGGLATDVSGLESDLELFQAEWITAPAIWTVGAGGDYATLEAAWEDAIDLRLAPGASLTISLLSGTHALSAPLYLDHPDGAEIEIVGSSESTVIVTSPSGGFYVTEGHQFGRIASLTLDGSDSAESGIVVQHGARVRVEDVTVTDFYAGLYVEGGIVHGTDVTATGNGYAGAKLFGGGRVELTSLDASDNGGQGVDVRDSLLFVGSLDITGNPMNTALVTSGGIINAGIVTSSGATAGIFLSGRSVFIGLSGTYSGPWSPLVLEDGSFADVGFATFSNADTAIYSSWNSVVRAGNAEFDDTVTDPGETFFGGLIGGI